MPVIDLSKAQRVYLGETEAQRIYVGEQMVWQKQADGLSALYGLGAGKVELHFAPEDSVFDGNGKIASVPNRGGIAGVYAYGKGNTGVSGNYFTMPAASDILQISAPIDAASSRVFMVTQSARAWGTRSDLLGNNPGVNLGKAVVYQNNNSFSLSRYDNITWVSATSSIPAAPAGSVHLIEMQFFTGEFQVWVDGVAGGATPRPNPAVDFNGLFCGDRLESGPNGFIGDGGEVLMLRIGPEGAPEAVVQQIRQHLASRYPITLSI